MESAMDAISEIMSWASPETVGRSRLLSKEWNRRSYEAYFSDLRRKRAGMISGVFIKNLFYCKSSCTFVNLVDKISPINLSLSFLPGYRVKILASTTEGLLFCESTNLRHHHRPDYLVTQQWRKIPKPKTRYFTQRVAMRVVSLNPLQYKILRFSIPSPHRSPNKRFPHHDIYKVEIFDSKYWSWKELAEIYLPYVELFSFAPVTVCGNFHWLASTENIFTFYDEDGSWDLFSLPPEAIGKETRDLTLTKYEGRLALVNSGGDNVIELWVVEDYYNGSWSKKYTIDVEALREEEPFASFISFCDADTFVMKAHRTLVFYDMRNRTFEVRTTTDANWDEVFMFQSDSKEIQLRNNS